MVKQKEIMTSQEVADMLGVDLNYLYFLRRSNQLIPMEQKTIRVKPRLRYRRADVDSFLTQREQDKEAHSRRKSA
jgi:hypothetical protein